MTSEPCTNKEDAEPLPVPETSVHLYDLLSEITEDGVDAGIDRSDAIMALEAVASDLTPAPDDDESSPPATRTVSPRLVNATLSDGRVSINANTRMASLTARPTDVAPLSSSQPAAYLTIEDEDDDVSVEVSLKAADVRALYETLKNSAVMGACAGP